MRFSPGCNAQAPSIGKLVAIDVADSLVVEGKARSGISFYDAVAGHALFGQSRGRWGVFRSQSG